MARKKSVEDRWGSASAPQAPVEDVVTAIGGDPDEGPNATSVAGFAREQLKSFVERIERLEEEKKTFADDIKDVFAEAKGAGFDVKALREILKIRKQDADQRAEHEAIVDLYRQALGMIADTPLGRAALAGG